MIYFISGSKSKQNEMERLCKQYRIPMASADVEINELQTKNLEELVKDKVKKAFDKLKRPLFVEHTMLELELESGRMSHFPGALTSIIWEELGEKRFSELFGGKKAKATAVIGYCDGKKIYTFHEPVFGFISSELRGDKGFGWDKLFVPDGQEKGQEKTFAELEHENNKDKFSMRSAVLKQLAEQIHNGQDPELDQDQNFEELCQAIKDKRVILFVGAGVSMNLKLPSWRKLISTMAEELGYEEEVFNSYGDYLTLAEYYVLKKGKAELKNLLDVFRSPQMELEEGEVHDLLVKLQFPIIYTTNYDRLLEESHKKFGSDNYTAIVTLNDMLMVGNNVNGQIVKFHGDVDDLDSVVLDETSYFERMNFESALDIKMRADMLGRSVLFIGYSLGDFNVRYLMYKLHKLWDSTKDPQSKPKSYIFLTSPNPLLKEVLFEKRGITTFTSKVNNHGEGLKGFLEALLMGVKDIYPQ